MYACVRGDEAMVQMLLDAGADINSEVGDDVELSSAILVPTLGEIKEAGFFMRGVEGTFPLQQFYI